MKLQTAEWNRVADTIQLAGLSAVSAVMTPHLSPGAHTTPMHPPSW
jgi:hypothetical protein